MNSVWAESVNRLQFMPLQQNISTNVLIIGGGMAGLLCAHALKNAGVDCVLVEADRICCGVTENTTAKITLQHGLIYNKLISRFGQEKARLYLKAQAEACAEYARLCEGIDCNYEKQDSFVYSLNSCKELEKELVALSRLGLNASLCAPSALPFDAAGAICVKGQAQFHPLKFAFEIAKGLTIYENTKVLQLMPNKAITNRGEIRCKKIIVATHFPILNKHGGYFLKLYQHRSYVIALEGAQDVRGMYVDENKRGLSFRSYQGLLLLGGGGHRTGKQGGNFKELEAFARRHYPKAKIVNKWATQDCITLDGVPYIGQYSASTPKLYVATGFNKWGMSSSMVAAKLLADLVQGKSNRYANLFSPSRSMFTPQLAVNAVESLIGLVTPTTPRCPHLGCALKYNAAEHSWDCPCHGSRFTESGKLINNPATDDKKL